MPQKEDCPKRTHSKKRWPLTGRSEAGKELLSMLKTPTRKYHEKPSKVKQKGHPVKRLPFYYKKPHAIPLKTAIKKGVMDWHSRGYLPDSVVITIFKAVNLRGA